MHILAWVVLCKIILLSLIVGFSNTSKAQEAKQVLKDERLTNFISLTYLFYYYYGL